MIKIIHNKRYNTDKAQIIETAVGGDPGRKRIRWKEALYQKRSGEFFLYRHNLSDAKEENILPLSLEEAKEWANKHMDKNKYDELFSIDTQKDSAPVAICTQLKASTAKKLSLIAIAQGTSQTAVLERLISEAEMPGDKRS